MPDLDILTDLCEKRLWEQAASRVLMQLPGSSRFARVRQIAAIRREAFAVALDDVFHWEPYYEMVKADTPYPEIADALPMNPMLRPDVAWALLLTVSSPDNVFRRELERYLRRHKDAPKRLPHKIVIEVGSGTVRHVTAQICELTEGESDLQIVRV